MRLPPPRATIAICGTTALAWLVVSLAGLSQQVAVLAGFVPARLSALAGAPGCVPVILTPLTATLVHASLLHLAFNLLMLGFCARFVEATVASAGLVVLYVVGAYASAGAQWLADPASSAPMIGASGAVSAVVGAYALLFGRRQVTAWGPRSALAIHILWLAIAWIALQALVGIAGSGLPGVPHDGRIAVAAHIGGFLAGLVLARPLLMFRYRNA